MLKSIRKFILRLAVTPERARSLITRVLSLFLQWATETQAWDSVSRLPKWLRRLADFIERWNETEIPTDKAQLIAELVRHALTDDAVEHLIDEVAALELKRVPDGALVKED